MTKNKRIELLEDYIRLLEKEARRTHGIIFSHGYVCDVGDYEKGERLRAELGWVAHEEAYDGED